MKVKTQTLSYSITMLFKYIATRQEIINICKQVE